jgi:hypothetical protein
MRYAGGVGSGSKLNRKKGLNVRKNHLVRDDAFISSRIRILCGYCGGVCGLYVGGNRYWIDDLEH